MLLADCYSRRWKIGCSFFRGPRLVSDSQESSSMLKPGFARSPFATPIAGGIGNKTRGFSLIELLLVMAILTTISAIAIPHLVSALDSAKLAKAVGDLSSIQTDIVGYESIHGKLPDSLAQIGDGAFLDPWKSPYQYLNYTNLQGNGIARNDRFLLPLNSDYELYSLGKDGQTAAPITAATSQDDVIRVGTAGYFGLASKY
jgi:general secretion pathway protein G